MSVLCTFEQITPGDREQVGGKALSLGLMANAGLPVPPGFCVTTDTFRQRDGKDLPPALAGKVAQAYRELGGGRVAVRSSATAEDGSSASFAGQQETILGVQGESAVCEAVARCWASLHTERAVAYRRQQGIGDDGLAMAVVVQRLVPAEVAGVLFTRDPLDPGGKQMLVEAAWGLGEAVVSGKVTPDRWHIDRETGAVRDRHLSAKILEITADGPQPVAADRQELPSLDDRQLAELAELGRRVEAFYGQPRDIEWALADGRFWLLQARPITTADAFEREQVRLEEVRALAETAEPSGTVWSRFNLSEILAEPTPMTWAVVRHFMSGKGGFGLMYRDLGFDPDPALDELGIFDLVCGRPYCNLSREPRMHYRELPFEHPFAILKANPRKALYPQAVPNPGRLDWKSWLLLPVTLFREMIRIARADRLRKELAQTFAQSFRHEIVPAYVKECELEMQRDLAPISSRELIERFEMWRWRVLEDFARQSLKPTALALLAMGNLERRLVQPLGAERASQAVRELLMGVTPDPDTDLPAALRDLAAGRMDQAEFQRRFGHRGSHEMELAQPRWSESGFVKAPMHPADDKLASSGQSADMIWERIAAEAKLAPALAELLRSEVTGMLRWVGLRETAKHYLMMGYAILRRLLLELDRRCNLHGGIFYLTPGEELSRLVAGEDLTAVIAQRKRRRTLLLTLEVPSVLFSDDLDAIGRQEVVQGTATLEGSPLSAGVAEAPALVLAEPTSETPPGPYVLVCPSTDPAWVPLFVGARALVMETGGVLSHGAIVAREFGLPAVAGIPGVHRAIKNGQRLRVDGGRGTVTLLDPDPATAGS